MAEQDENRAEPLSPDKNCQVTFITMELTGVHTATLDYLIL
jgi:hypothetical protein